MAKKPDTDAPTVIPVTGSSFSPTLVLGLADGSVIRQELGDNPTPESVMSAATKIANELALRRTM